MVILLFISQIHLIIFNNKYLPNNYSILGEGIERLVNNNSCPQRDYRSVRNINN